MENNVVEIKVKTKTGSYFFNDVLHEFNIDENMGLNKKKNFVKEVISLVVSDDYLSILRNPMFDITLIKYLTDIDLSWIYDSADALSEIDEFLTETGVAEYVKNSISNVLLDELNEAVDNAIAYKTGIDKNIVTSALSKFLKVLEQKTNEIDTEKMMETANMISNIQGGLSAEKIVEAYAKSDLYKKVVNGNGSKKRKYK